MGVTIKDIAKKTGLSITSISLVLNKRENRISEKSRQIIESAAQELNYSPNQAAVSLSTKKTNLIALIIPKGTFFYFADLVSSMENACRNAGYSLSISLPEADGDSCLEAIGEMLRRDADGIFFDPSGFNGDFPPSYMDMAINSDTPIVSLASVGAQVLPNSVLPDHRQGAYLAASHLLELGHTSIAFIAGQGYLAPEQLSGITEALEEYRLNPETMPTLFGANTAAFGSEGLDMLLKTHPVSGGFSAIVTGSDIIAGGVLRRAYEMGISIPRQLSVTGYGNISPGADFFVPLTTVSIHYDRIARKAVNLIRKFNQNSPALTPELVPPSLIIRGSTAPKKSGDA
ncbi:LacI family transcriptional regulator [Spirochaetia bacterium]|nr:LacI family transcriptional regulator [Spirochaetia bacterium]